MNAPRPRVAEAIRRFAEPLDRCSPRVRTVLGRIRDCRTAVFGGHVWRCRSCDHERIAYNSCRDRHCPQCQATRSREWLKGRLAEVLPVPHFHAVFTLPEELRPIALGNPRAIYTLLFEAAAATLTTIGRDPKHLGATLAFFGILHTWGQTLDYHPHVHFVIPGGGIALDGSAWVPSCPRFLISQRVLASLYRRLLLEGLEQLRVDGVIDLPSDLHHSHRWRRLRKRLGRRQWVVHLREPFATPGRVLEYLARYTHRVAIADGRIRAIDDDGVMFDYQDYRTARRKTMRLAGEEFVRRFALHVLPERFVRIRYYGFLAHRGRTANLARCRALIQEGGHGVTATETRDAASTGAPNLREAPVVGHDDEIHCCPKCKAPMVHVRVLERGEGYAKGSSRTRAPPITA